MMQQEMTIVRWLFNPFIRIAGTASLVAGLAAIGAGGFVAATAGIRFDGLLDMHFATSVPVWLPVLEGLLNWIVFSVLCVLIARLFGGGMGARLVDIAGTQAMARAPLVPAAAICTLPWIRDSAAEFTAAFPSVDLAALGAGVLVGGVVMLVGVVWMVVLMWNAFSVSTNMKGARGTVLFIAAVVVGELISKFLVLRYP